MGTPPGSGYARGDRRWEGRVAGDGLVAFERGESPVSAGRHPPLIEPVVALNEHLHQAGEAQFKSPGNASKRADPDVDVLSSQLEQSGQGNVRHTRSRVDAPILRHESVDGNRRAHHEFPFVSPSREPARRRIAGVSQSDGTWIAFRTLWNAWSTGVRLVATLVVPTAMTLPDQNGSDFSHLSSASRVKHSERSCGSAAAWLNTICPIRPMMLSPVAVMLRNSSLDAGILFASGPPSGNSTMETQGFIWLERAASSSTARFVAASCCSGVASCSAATRPTCSSVAA